MTDHRATQIALALFEQFGSWQDNRWPFKDRIFELFMAHFPEGRMRDHCLYFTTDCFQSIIPGHPESGALLEDVYREFERLRNDALALEMEKLKATYRPLRIDGTMTEQERDRALHENLEIQNAISRLGAKIRKRDRPKGLKPFLSRLWARL